MFLACVCLALLTAPLQAKEMNGFDISNATIDTDASEHVFCEALLRGGADVESQDVIGNTPLMAAAFKGDLDAFKLLVNFGASADQKNKTQMTARDWAVMFSRNEVVTFIDQTTPPSATTSKLKSWLRFTQLSFLMLKERVFG